MCFSANASFTASALLALASIITIAKVKESKQYVFAAIPFFFALQQAIEGLLWLSFSHRQLNSFQSFFMYTFLFFAFVIWPIYVPFSVRLLETDVLRKKLINICVLTGVAIAIVFLYLFTRFGATVSLEHNHIVYDIKSSLFVLLPSAIIYACATILPFFFSNRKLMWLFGILLLASYIISWTFYKYAFISVWCFFVALLSIVVYAIV